MKIGFLFLLLANGMLFLWQSYFVAPATVGSTPMPGNVPELVLLQETGTTVQAASVVAIEPEQPDSKSIDGAILPVSASKSCYTIGPFDSDDALKKVQQLFVDNKIDFRQRTFTEPELFGYNVLLPPFPSRDAAVAMVKILVQKGITDYYIMRDSELDNAISLGLFREHRFAVRHMTFLEKKGLTPEMKTRYYDRSRHWIDYTEQENRIDETALVRMSPESDVQRLLRACG